MFEKGVQMVIHYGKKALNWHNMWNVVLLPKRQPPSFMISQHNALIQELNQRGVSHAVNFPLGPEEKAEL